MTIDLGKLQVTSLAVATPDAGDVVGLGVIFDSPANAEIFIEQVSAYFETPATESRYLGIEFKDFGSYCDISFDILNFKGTTAIRLDQADRRVLQDVTRALKERPYFFVIACLVTPNGVEPYKADDLFLVRGYLVVNGNQIDGNPNGKWPVKYNPFA